MSLGHSSNACRLRAASKECFRPLMFPEVCCSESRGAGLKGKEFWNLLSSCGGAGGAPRAHCLIQCPLSCLPPTPSALRREKGGSSGGNRGPLGISQKPWVLQVVLPHLISSSKHIPWQLGVVGGPGQGLSQDSYSNSKVRLSWALCSQTRFAPM